MVYTSVGKSQSNHSIWGQIIQWRGYPSVTNITTTSSRSYVLLSSECVTKSFSEQRVSVFHTAHIDFISRILFPCTLFRCTTFYTRFSLYLVLTPPSSIYIKIALDCRFFRCFFVFVFVCSLITCCSFIYKKIHPILLEVFMLALECPVCGGCLDFLREQTAPHWGLDA